MTGSGLEAVPAEDGSGAGMGDIPFKDGGTCAEIGESPFIASVASDRVETLEFSRPAVSWFADSFE